MVTRLLEWECLHDFVFQLARASNAVLSLERLNSNYYRGLYRRKRELGFCGEVVAQNPWLLSTGKGGVGMAAVNLMLH